MERLSGLDASFLYLETPTHHMHVAATLVLDPSTMPGGYSFDAVKAFMASRLHLVPPFRRRIMEVPFKVHHPIWVEDPDFDIDRHVRRVAAPSPGGRRELAEVTGLIASVPLDRSRPLWELSVIEGLKHGRIGIVIKVHHSAIDGASAAELMVNLFDLAPDAPVPEAPEHEVEALPSEAQLLGFATVSRLRRNLGILPLLGRTVQSVNRVAQGRRAEDPVVGGVPLRAPKAPWNEALGPDRGVGLGRVPLADLKAIKDHFGTTVNDVVLALCGGALRHYLADHGGVPDEPLLAVVPVSVRGADDAAGGNRVSAMFTYLATDVEDAGERLKAIAAATRGAKEEHNAVGADMLGNWAEFAGPSWINLAARLYTNLRLAGSHRPVHNLIISNIPGPDLPLYFAGAELVASYPMGPAMEGVGLNVTVMSYRGSVDIGCLVDPDLVPDVWDLVDGFGPALAELRAAAGMMDPEPGDRSEDQYVVDELSAATIRTTKRTPRARKA